jgi:aspartyl/asparaginyl beta-hydroxylase (cupin superfamily)
MSEIWYTASGGKYYKENEPCFFEPSQCPWAIEIENHWNEFKDEIKHLISEQDKNFISNSYLNIATNNGWSSLSFFFWGYPQKDISLLRGKCPTLTDYLANIPVLVSASLSKLEPQTIINEHRGDTNAVFRCHLGIEIPASLPQCGIKVSSEEKSWAEGKWLFFNDAWKHSAWNKTDKRRIVLIIDVIRPEFIAKQRAICARILARHILLSYQSKSKLIKSLPRLFKNMLLSLIYVPLYIAGPKRIA